MSDLTDPAAAAAAVADPNATAVDLSLIAQHHPQLRAQVAMHPAAYPGLLDWLEGLGDPMLTAVVAVRRGADRRGEPQAARPDSFGALAQPATPTGPVPFSQSGEPSPAWTEPVPASAPARASGSGKAGKRLVIGLASLVVVLALVAGFATRGFGLLRFGGAATPAEEATKVADKTVGLFNSFSLKNLISNPISALGDLNDEIAPSESSLRSNFTKVDNSDLLALSNDSMSLAADLVGSFKVTADGLKTEVSDITDDVAQVSFTKGEITVTADTDRLRKTLDRFPDVAAAQVETTLAKYGLKPKKAVDLNLPSGWSDEFMTTVEDTFPYRLDLADCAGWFESGQTGGAPELGSVCTAIGRLVMVKEDGKWYLSPMLTWSSSIGNVSGLGGTNAFSDPERRKMLSVAAEKHPEPIDAPGSLIHALNKADEATTLAEFPLAERRYAAATGLLASADLSGYEATFEFSEIARSGNQAKLRIEKLSLVNGSTEFAIKDGTCISSSGTTNCLRDLLNSDAIDNAFASLREQDWASFEEATGVSGDKVISKLETATRAAVKALDPDQIGLIAVQENGGWLVSFTATSSELQNQLAAAVRAGLLSIQE